MTRRIDADVVLAALDVIEDVAADRVQLQAVRLSIVRRRIAALRQSIENQAVEHAE